MAHIHLVGVQRTEQYLNIDEVKTCCVINPWIKQLFVGLNCFILDSHGWNPRD